jgi:glycine hydroxymethyltransferase
MRISVGADHRGVALAASIKSRLTAHGHQVIDHGTRGTDPVDYPNFAFPVGEDVSEGRADVGLLVCGSGFGMAIAANKVAGVRAVVCETPAGATRARSHNDANVLVLGSDDGTVADPWGVVEAFLDGAFEGGRHVRRINQIAAYESARDRAALEATDPEVAGAIRGEIRRQQLTLELIASENIVSDAVLEALGSPLTNKYAEGYPGKRYYGGCEHVDVAERLAIDRAKDLFGAEHANVQAHSGATANMIAYFALAEPGAKLMGMQLAHGGHLTHGHPVSFSGRFFHVSQYGVSQETETIDYDALRELARKERPHILVAGASAYPRVLNFAAFRSIADEVGAHLVVDMAHIAGLVAAGVHPSPVPFADIVTSTTHKTLRGPRGGFVLSRAARAAAIDKTAFPGMQGGPLMHVIAAKAVCFQEALQDSFRAYARQVVANAAVLADRLTRAGTRIVSGGTDTHLMLVDLRPRSVTGRDAERALEAAGITVNKNAIPYDPQKPAITSGIRIGTPAVTTRGMKEPEMEMIAALIARVLDSIGDPTVASSVRADVESLCRKFPIYTRRQPYDTPEPAAPSPARV